MYPSNTKIIYQPKLINSLKQMKKLYLFLVIVAFAQSIFSQKVINLNSDNSVSTKMAAPAGIPQEYLKEAKAARVFSINPALQSARNVNVNDIVNLQLFETDNFTAKISDIVTDINGTLALTMLLPDFPMGFAIIVTNTEGKSLVNIAIPELGKSFGSRCNNESNMNYLIEVDESKREYAPLDNDVIEIPKEIQLYGEGNATPQQAPQQAPPACSPDPSLGENDPATISLLVVYTSAAANSSYSTNRGGMANVISSMIALGNLCLSNSQTKMTIGLAHSVQVSYVETDDMYVSLPHLQNPSDGHMDEIHALRTQYNADLVQMLSMDSNSGGLGYNLSNTNGNYSYGFSVCYVTQVGDTYPCSIHELGHNMGLGHGAQQTSVTAEGIFPYSKGWRLTGNTPNWYGNNYYTSVMSYAGNYYGDGLSSQYIPYFSNPDVSYLGAPTGNATNADAARSLREMKHVVAFYSDKAASIPADPTNIVVSNPTNNGATFSWDAVPGATEYHIVNNGSFFVTANTSYSLNYSPWFSPCTTYNISIRASNSCGSSIGTPVTFTTKCVTNAPTVITNAATAVTQTTATLNKTVTEGSETITEQGFKYKKTADATWLTSATGTLTGLTPNTQYEFYAYAVTATYPSTNGATLTFTTADTSTEEKIQIFPNPAKDEIFIQSASQIEKVEIYSLTGSLLLLEDNFNEKMFVSILSPGIYLVKVYTDNGCVVSKIMKE